MQKPIPITVENLLIIAEDCGGIVEAHPDDPTTPILCVPDEITEYTKPDCVYFLGDSYLGNGEFDRRVSW